MRESALIELAAYATRMSLATISPDASNQRDVHECGRLTEQLGLSALETSNSLEDIELHWRKQLRVFRQKDILRMGMLLASQEAVIACLRMDPREKRRLQSCYVLGTIQETLEAQFELYGLQEAFMLMPHIPWPDAPITSMVWSGDALRECVIRELDALSASATAPSDTP